MNGFDVDDDLIREAFERRARRGDPVGLAKAIAERTARAPQSHQVTMRAPSSMRLLAVAAVLVTTAGLGLAIAGNQPRRPDPDTAPAILGDVHEAMTFIRPFAYRLDPSTALVQTVEVEDMFMLRVGAARPDEGPYDDESGVAWGVAIAAPSDPHVHPCPLGGGRSRVPIRETPAAMLDDLRDIAGVALGPVESGTLDGRPSVSARVDPLRNGCPFADLHVAPGGGGSGFTRFDLPSRLWITKVDGLSVVLQVWASTDEALEAALPAGTAIVESVTFAVEVAASDQPIEYPFARNFTYPSTPSSPLEGPIRSQGFVAFARSHYQGDPYQDMAEGAWGITISPTRDAHVHSCGPGAGGRVQVRETPEEFLADLDRLAGVGTDAAPATFDGRPALVATLDPSRNRCIEADLHPAGSGLGLGSSVQLDLPSRLTVTDVAGVTLMISVWARTPETLETVLPDADAFLDQVHFPGNGTLP